ncbi:hypothetical protein A3C98_04835 [Candidatus Roizmanbacteria bacterium RIFCSPHIGHO2_02_FULL_37_15]|uniref:Uncharacterized protein n=1 Tax=Candidatus Roizmanbacteria bacterium RIFCSPLOWO2_01_FULL_37_16 TaxID=1802058 RepID=A0A1F7IQN6_9BACT|nr:MAG: hypothetical protein A2859_03420 [Candidatus Roizmanbacteria bacterium RIFCSPHIGHO2_01_FULL_37_16b]OGK22397.1 MAG: hypothetical protein A3C98_04835 [Candidatus Roizmanbacteria bacterium RIFCSPHIGHO2_02_FULL_37_15]OGK32137.1 MAG: hypothetical protein A3F57_03645 [Candidatus Roizmanbacteria bacterium RIFCSPHIGHO2_12_FULL_36_11]OGK45667.1 MAG: hypothetical protein A3B40_04270 [Candidatus Roizmanbacteria bacterium RIFCSPLOWO2_01_FULL_37_16]OGK57861.1 MAG: hypothetical protein A3I50_02330 [C
MKIDKVVLANAFALTMGITYIVCRLLVSLFPRLFMQITRSWFHLIDLTRISGADLGLELFILGLLSSIVSAWLFGYLLGWSIEYFSKK